MKILGINGLGILPSACIIDNGKLLVIGEEEKFNRFKGSFGLMPIKATKFCLDFANLTLDDIDYIAFGWDCNKYRFYMPLFFAYKYLTRSPKFQKSSNVFRTLNELSKYHPKNVRSHIAEMLRAEGITGKIPQIKFIEHHLAHAASTFYFSGYKESYILIVDGSGEDKSTSIYKGDGNKITLIKSFNIPDSLGWFYQSLTEYLGFRPNSHEGKLMGLSTYGKKDETIIQKMNEIIQTKKSGKYTFKAKFAFLGNHTHGNVYSDELIELLGPPRKIKDELSEYHKNVAHAGQLKLEDTVENLLQNIIFNQSDFNSKLCLAGGVSLNCKMNGRIAQYSAVNEIFIPPFSSDVGTSVGAAMVLSERLGELKKLERLEHAYWASEYSDDYIEQILIKNKIKYTKYENIEKIVAELLYQNKIIGWYQGRMEVGPRALGGRSILASPVQNETRDIVNKRVKNREDWRPFALSILDEDKYELIDSPQDSPFMAISFMVKEKYKTIIPAGIHIDNSTRPQFVKRSTNKLYWDLINEFKKLSGVGAILNTSFNLDEEPIVEHPQQAIRTFYASGLDYLAIGSYLISKE